MIRKYLLVCAAAVTVAVSGCGLSVGEKEIATVDSLLTSLAEVYTVDFDVAGPDDITKIDYAVLHLYKVSPEKFQEGRKDYLVKIDKDAVDAAAQAVFVTAIKEHQSTNEVDFEDGFYEMRRPSDNDEFLYCKTEGEGVVSGDTLIINAGVFSGKKDVPGTEASLYKSMQTKIILKDGVFKVAEYRSR